MIQGNFGESGQLYFEIDLIATDGSIVTIDALLDTGFTGTLAMDIQDIESLGWLYLDKQKMRTARGEVNFQVYEGVVCLDGQELTVPVLAGRQITEVLIGLSWWSSRRLVLDRKAGLRTLGED